MNPPQVYMCSPSWTLLPPPSPYCPSGSSQCTSPKHPVSCIESGLATRFIYDIIHVSVPWILCKKLPLTLILFRLTKLVASKEWLAVYLDTHMKIPGHGGQNPLTTMNKQYKDFMFRTFSDLEVTLCPKLTFKSLQTISPDSINITFDSNILRLNYLILKKHLTSILHLYAVTSFS